MTSQPQIPEEIISTCERCTAAHSEADDVSALIEIVSGEMTKLLKQKKFFSEMLLGVFERAGYPDLRQSTMFDNELLLYYDPVHKFSTYGQFDLSFFNIG